MRKSYEYNVKTVYYRKIVLQYAESSLEVILTFRDDLLVVYSDYAVALTF